MRKQSIPTKWKTVCTEMGLSHGYVAASKNCMVLKQKIGGFSSPLWPDAYADREWYRARESTLGNEHGRVASRHVATCKEHPFWFALDAIFSEPPSS